MTEGINYTPEPTLELLHESNALVKGIRGPEGSGKTVGCFFDLFKYTCMIEPYRGVRHGKFAVIRSCYDDQTEILTERRGWVLFKNLSETDKVATLVDGKELFFEKPPYYFSADYNGEMLGYSNESIDFLVTPDHRMWTMKPYGRKKVRTEYRQRKAEDIYKKHWYRVKRNAEWSAPTPGRNLDFYEFLGFWFAEGSASSTEKPDRNLPMLKLTLTTSDREYTEKLLERNNFKYGKSHKKNGCYNYNIFTKGNRKLVEELRGYGKSLTKSVPQWIKDSPPEHIRAFLLGYIMGDGTFRANSGKSTHCYTNSKKLADDVQELCLRAGYVANINSRKRKPNGKSFGVGNTEYTITIVTPKKHEPWLWPEKWYKKQYNGKVYCVEVSSHVVYVRRNGKAFWCNQTYPELLTTGLVTFEDWFSDYIVRVTRQPPVEAIMRMDLGDGTTAEMWLLFLALDIPNDVKKVKSLEVTGTYIIEATEVARWVLTRTFGRRGRFPPKKWGIKPPWAGVIMDTNSCDDDHWWYKAAEEEKPENWEFFDQPSALLQFRKQKSVNEYLQNNTHLTPDFRKVVKDIQGNFYVGNPQAENVRNQQLGINYWLDSIPGRPMTEIITLVMNDYGLTTDDLPVYPEYRDNVHCAKEELKPTPDIGITLGMDFGLKPACTISQISPLRKKCVIDEMYVEKHGAMGIRQLSREVLVPYLLDNYLPWLQKGIVKGYGDPAGSQRGQTDEKTCYMILNEGVAIKHEGIVDYKKNAKMLNDKNHVKRLKELAKEGLVSLGDLGIQMRPARTNKFKTRRDAVSKLMISDDLLISPKCKMLRKACRGKYRYKRVQVSGEDRYQNEPVKDIYCVPLNTDALTPDGWKKHNELRVGDKIYGAILNNDKPCMVETTVHDVNIFHGDYDVINLCSQTMNFQSTPNHRHLIKTRNKVWKYRETKDLKQGNHIVGPAAKHEAPKKTLFSRDFISIAGWVFAEGTYRKDGAIVVVQSNRVNPRYVEYLSGLLKNHPCVSYERARESKPDITEWRINKELALLLRKMMPNKVPSIEFINLMSNRDRRLFLYEFIRGDGCCSNGNGKTYMPDKEKIGRNRDFWVSKQTTMAFQKSKGAAEAIQTIATYCGIATHVRPYKNGYCITFAKSNFHEIRPSMKGVGVVDGVWCPTTTTGNWICRQNGRVYITGNSNISDAFQYDCLESEFMMADPAEKEKKKVKEHRKEIGNAACAAWDELDMIRKQLSEEAEAMGGIAI